EVVDYLFAVASTGPGILWESTVTDAYRSSPPPGPPILFGWLNPDAAPTFADWTERRVLLGGFRIVQWHDADPERRRVATAWYRLKLTADETPLTPVDVLYSMAGQFIEIGEAEPAPFVIKAWTSTPGLPDALIVGNTLTDRVLSASPT